jgi:hypothetical protein
LISTYDNTNSLHTNAYDEAITTPTEESVRRAMAIQLIINREWASRRTRTRTRESQAPGAVKEVRHRAIPPSLRKRIECAPNGPEGGLSGLMMPAYGTPSPPSASQ